MYPLGLISSSGPQYSGSPPSNQLQGERLAKLIAHRRTLLVLDGLEPLQNPPGPQEGRVREPSLQALLRELAAFRTENGCAISLYLNLDPSEVPTPGDAQSRMNALLTEAGKTDRSDLTHDARRVTWLPNLLGSLAIYRFQRR